MISVKRFSEPITTTLNFGWCHLACATHPLHSRWQWTTFLNHFFIVLLLYSLTIFWFTTALWSSTFLTWNKHFRYFSKASFSWSYKCSFGQKQVEYLGHMVSSQGVEPVFAKIQAIRQWPSPKSFKALRSFLGLARFYRCFIRGYASIATPLTTLLTCENFKWPPSAQLTFDQLKIAVSSTPVLRLPDFSIPFFPETNASSIGMGVVLTQKGHPIAFFSKAFSPKLLQASTYVRELATITVAVKKWRQYLLGHHFTILTDHRSLKELMTQVI